MRYLDLDGWNRKEHFHFFKAFEEPFFGVVVDMDVTKTYQNSKENNISFFCAYLHKSLMAANEIDNFKQREIEKKIKIYMSKSYG